jgi:hypothetical protein
MVAVLTNTFPHFIQSTYSLSYQEERTILWALFSARQIHSKYSQISSWSSILIVSYNLAQASLVTYLLKLRPKRTDSQFSHATCPSIISSLISLILGSLISTRFHYHFGQRHFSSPKRLDRRRGPSSLLFKRYLDPLSGEKWPSCVFRHLPPLIT